MIVLLSWEEKMERVRALAAALRARADELVQATIDDVGFTFKDCQREAELTAQRLPAFEEARGLLERRSPVCEHPEDEVALVLPYDGSTWLNIAIVSIFMVGNRTRVKFSSKGSRISKLTEEIYKPIFEDAVTFDYAPGKSFVEWALADPGVKSICFFGSDRNALPLKDAVRRTGKKFVFEGPGNDPFIVLEDADLGLALDDLVEAKYIYSGQTCTAPERIYVHSAVYEEFLREFVARSQALVVGDPTEAATDVAPLASSLAVENIRAQIEDAVARGGRIACGGRIEGHLVYPTVVANATPEMLGVREESFGPVSFVQPFDDLQEVPALARNDKYALRAAVYGGKQAHELAASLRGAPYLEPVGDFVFGTFGTVSVNEPRRESWVRALITKPIGGYGYSGWVWEPVNGELKLLQGPKLFSIETSVPN